MKPTRRHVAFIAKIVLVVAACAALLVITFQVGSWGALP